MDGATGFAAVSLRAFATANPQASIASINSVNVTTRAAPATRLSIHAAKSEIAAKANGQKGGSCDKVK